MKVLKFSLCLLLLFFVACKKEEGAKIGTKAPFISVRSSSNLEKISDFKGLCVLVFIQDGCAFCLKNLPLLSAYAKEKKVKVYAIDSISKDAAFNKMVKKLNLKNISFFQDNLNISWQKYSIFAVPTIIIIKNNIVKARIIGDKQWHFIKAKLASF